MADGITMFRLKTVTRVVTRVILSLRTFIELKEESDVLAADI
jgi:hypothetical protein